MTDGGERDVITYVRALERQLERFHEPPFVLSPKDWALAEDWHGRGVPLELVVECLEAAAERRPRGRRPRRPPLLAHVKAEVEEGWTVIRQGRLPAAGAGKPVQVPGDARALWERAAERAGAATALGRLLSELLARLREGADADAIDARLERELVQVVPEGLVEEVRRGAAAEILPFRGRWDPATFEAACERALRSRLRRRLGLPRL
jgi:hypothetical protein